MRTPILFGLVPMMSAAIINEQDEVERYSESRLTDGQIKQSIEHRKYHIARFLDLKDTWHCFFYTFKSLKGKEHKFREDRPHMHYVSNAWGFKREDALKQLLSRKYSLGSTPHIDFIRYE
jgi:hypothetical protein